MLSSADYLAYGEAEAKPSSFLVRLLSFLDMYLKKQSSLSWYFRWLYIQIILNTINALEIIVD